MSGLQRKIRLLTFTNLYPNSAQPGHGLFVERRLCRLVERGCIGAVVVAPVPRSRDEVPPIEIRHGIEVHHPRFFTIRGLGRFIAPFSMMLASLRLVKRLAAQDGFDLIDAHYFYPDGVAAALLSAIVGKPLVITARGTDINVLPSYFFSRTLILWAARRAARIITVSEALRQRLIGLGVCQDKIDTLRNGVDTQEFAPRDRAEARKRLDLPDGLVLLSVGNLIESKGHHLVIEALQSLPRGYLVVAGDGEYGGALRAFAARLGVTERVRFAGLLSQEQLVDYYSAADMLVLATLREGMPNVVLEAVSCGLPIVATDCGGIAEVVDRPEMGILMRDRSAGAVADAVEDLSRRYPSRAATRAAALRLRWETTIDKQAALYDAITT